MKRLLMLSLLAVILTVSISSAEGYFPMNISPTGALDWSVYEYTDDIGDIIRTIPSPSPALNNALVGACWAEGMLIVFENIYPQTVPSKFYKIDPDDGSIIGEVTLPFNGFVMGASYDGSGIWVAHWYPENIIYKIDLDGAIISQFTPSTGVYSCRSVNVEGDYLWVGANANANDTKLFKMDMSGVILEEYFTSAVVGWYMGGEIDDNALSGANLFIVDDVGHTVKRLSVAGGSVTVIEQFGSPVDSSDYAEGLAFDGEYLWHNSGLAHQNLIWCIDDGISASVYDVTITLTPAVTPITIPAGGGSFEYEVLIENNETTAQTFNAWIDATLPNGTIFGPIILRTLTLEAGTNLLRNMDQFVPAGAPAGDYSYNGYVGSYPGTVWDSDSFPFTKSGADGTDYENGWYLYGWDEDDASSMNTIPADFSLSQNYPNPFNPETNISFALPSNEKVSLKIYNTLGEEVAVLVDGYMPSGVHNVVFSADGLSSGIYICLLNAGDFRAVKKMALLK